MKTDRIFACSTFPVFGLYPIPPLLENFFKKLNYSWFTVFQVYTKVIHIYVCVYIFIKRIWKIIYTCVRVQFVLSVSLYCLETAGNVAFVSLNIEAWWKSVIYMYIFFSIIGYCKILNIVSCAIQPYSGSLLFILYIIVGISVNPKFLIYSFPTWVFYSKTVASTQEGNILYFIMFSSVMTVIFFLLIKI